jgi:chlorite dismutase
MSSRASPSFTCFVPLSGPKPPAPVGARVTRYRVDSLSNVRGPGLEGIGAGTALCRIEATGQLAEPTAPFVGVSQHVVYTTGRERLELGRVSAAESGPVAVLIPICKSAAWWALAQDERQAYLQSGVPGHVEIGLKYASVIYRRLYHARAVPGSTWDFLTYFEFSPDQTDAFRDLLSQLRDPKSNPEWEFVEREVELWMTKVS